MIAVYYCDRAYRYAAIFNLVETWLSRNVENAVWAYPVGRIIVFNRICVHMNAFRCTFSWVHMSIRAVSQCITTVILLDKRHIPRNCWRITSRTLSLSGVQCGSSSQFTCPVEKLTCESAVVHCTAKNTILHLRCSVSRCVIFDMNHQFPWLNHGLQHYAFSEAITNWLDATVPAELSMALTFFGLQRLDAD